MKNKHPPARGASGKNTAGKISAPLPKQPNGLQHKNLKKKSPGWGKRWHDRSLKHPKMLLRCFIAITVMGII
jgi:hypothetical protein